MSIEYGQWISASTHTARRLVLSAILVATGSSLSVSALAEDEEKGTSFDFYGFVQADGIYDFNRMDSNWNDSLRPSKICSGEPGCGSDGETIFSVRQSRLGVAMASPTELGELTGKLEFELYGVGDDEGQTTPRLRHAYLDLGAFLAGQTWSNFMDIDVFPNSIEYWGPPGMILWRNIQARWTPMSSENSSFAIALEEPTSALDQGAGSSLDYTGTDEWPGLTAAWRIQDEWGHFKVAGILRSVGYESSANADREPSGSETGYGINLSGRLNTGANGALKGQLVVGEAIASYFNDGGIDIAFNDGADPEALPILGWLLFYDHSWSDKWSSSIGASGTEQDNSDGQTADAFKANRYGLVNLLYKPVEHLMLGGELQYGEYEEKGGVTRDDTRVQFTAKYSF